VSARVFTERGYDGTSMEHLAAASGITKSSIYHHVRGKESLLKLALQRAIDALFMVLDEPSATSGPAAERVEYVLRRAAEQLVAELPYVTLLLRVRGNTDTELWALGQRREFDRRVTALVADAVQAGELRDTIEPGLATRLMFGMLNSVTEWYRPGRGLTPEQLAGAIAGITLDGLRRPAAGSGPVG
jgi:AcrR family transcriptional regulator